MSIVHLATHSIGDSTHNNVYEAVVLLGASQSLINGIQYPTFLARTI